MQPLSTKMIEFASATLGVLEHFGVIKFDITGKSLEELQTKFSALKDEINKLNEAGKKSNSFDYSQMIILQLKPLLELSQKVNKQIRKLMNPDDPADEANPV